MAVAQSMAQFKFLGVSQSFDLETADEVSEEPSHLRGLSCGGATLSTAAVSRRRSTKGSNIPAKNRPLRALLKGRKSAALLAMICAAFGAPLTSFVMTHIKPTKSTNPSINAQGTNSGAGLAQVTLLPPLTTTISPPGPSSILRKPRFDVQGEISDSSALSDAKATEVATKTKRAAQEEKVGEETTLPCIKSPLWNTRVDSSKYEYGCQEIKVRLILYALLPMVLPASPDAVTIAFRLVDHSRVYYLLRLWSNSSHNTTSRVLGLTHSAGLTF